jgi:hypothetical protein
VIVVHAPKQGGLTFADMVHRTGIKKAADKAGKTIEFENADWDYLKQIIKTMGWGFFHEDILMFCEDIDSVK